MASKTIAEAFELAVRHHQAQRLHEAEPLYRQILAQEPNHAEALQLLGVLAHQLGRHEWAADAIGRAIAIRPDYPEAYCNLAAVLIQLGQLDRAMAACRQAIAQDPGMADAYSNWGNALWAKGEWDEAIEACSQAIKLAPGHAEAHNNLGNALKAKGEIDGAIAAYRRAIALKPNNAEAFNNLSNALQDRGELDEALEASRRALALSPRFAGAYVNLGNVVWQKGQVDEGLAAYRQAIALNPGYAEAFNNLGNALWLKGELDEALAAYRRALELRPDFAKVHGALAFALHFHPQYDAQAIGAEHRRWARRHAAPLEKSIRPHANDRSGERRLRIGYVSPDFRAHPVGRFMLPLLANHDRGRFEIFAYAQVARSDGMTEQLRGQTDQWRSLVGLSDERAAQLIRDDGIDILVDLAMHSTNNRLLVFARKPAPVQVTYLAYAGTTGLGTIDYRLSDPYLDPPLGGMAEDGSIYSEQTFRLPHTYWCYQPSDSAALLTPSATPPAVQTGHVTFGCLNNFCKISAPALMTWRELLGRVPGSTLLLHAFDGSHRQRAGAVLERQGIDPGRLRFVSHMATEEYLRLYEQIDIGLDPFPYGGGTTTCDALWMNVPVISLVGKTGVGRGGLSILSNLGMAELAVGTREEYVQVATGLAGDLPRLTRMRGGLREKMERSPLMDGPGFARDVEGAYRQMWKKWCGG